MQQIMQWIGGSLFFAMLGSFIWGIFTVILSPCHLAAIPLIIGYIGSRGTQTTKNAFHTSLIFSSGILFSVIIIGFITISLGAVAGNLGIWGNLILAAVLIFFGLNLMGIINLNWCNTSGAVEKGKNVKANHWGTLLMGLLIGIGLGPCTFAFMGPVLVVAFQSAGDNLMLAIIVMASYAFGYVGVIVLAGTFSKLVQRYLNWTEASRGAKIVKITCGILVLLFAIYTLWKAYITYI